MRRLPFKATTALLIVFLFTPGFLFSQLFYNASNLLPTQGASGQSVDVQSADLDKDGDFDIVLANEYQVNVILYNQGNAQFNPGSPETFPDAIHDSEDIAIADFNLDGWLDIVFVSEDTYEHEYYMYNGGGQYRLFQFLPFTACNAVAALDFNKDGFVDLFLGNQGQNMLLINDQTGHLENQTPFLLPQLADFTHDVKTADIDGDGDEDLVLAGEFANRIWINDGTGVFSDESTSRIPMPPATDSRKVALEDVDGDGDLDIFVATVMYSDGNDAQNRLYLNDGNGYFTDVTTTHLPQLKDQSLDALFMDVDIDGDKDLIVGGVLNDPIKCMLNDGSGRFQMATLAVLGDYKTMTDTLDALALINKDFNADGYEDIYIANRAGKDLLLLRDSSAVLNPPVAITEIEARSINLFPNPAFDEVNIEGISSSISAIQLIDQNGAVVIQEIPTQIDTTTYKLDLPGKGQLKGIYFIRLIFEDISIVRKIVIH